MNQLPPDWATTFSCYSIQKVQVIEDTEEVANEGNIHGTEIQSECQSRDTCILEMELEILKGEIELLKIRLPITNSASDV